MLLARFPTVPATKRCSVYTEIVHSTAQGDSAELNGKAPRRFPGPLACPWHVMASNLRVGSQEVVVVYDRLLLVGLISCLALAFPPVVRADEAVAVWDAPGDSTGLDHEASTPEGAQRVRERLASKFDVSESR